MAKRASLIKKKPKTIRVSKNAEYLANQKYLGSEPTFTAKPISEMEKARCLTWYNYMEDIKTAKQFIKEYLKNTGRVSESKMITSIPDNKTPMTTAWICRMISRGYQSTPKDIEFINDRIKIALTSSVEETPSETHKASIQDRMKDKQSDIIGQIEEMIDSNEPFSMYEWLQGQSIPVAYCQKIVDYYTPWLGELIEAYEGKSADLNQAYSHFTKKALMGRIKFMNEMLSDLERYSSNVKKVRKIRKPKEVSIEKKLQHFKFQKECNEFKLQSCDPQKVIGAQELWIFNSKYKTLSVFKALDRAGLQVSRTSITGYNDQTSMTMKIGRKTEQYLDRVLKGGKIVLKKLAEEMKTSVTQSRVNESTVLLKVSS